MANKGRKMVKCAGCGENFEADFWTVVRGDLDSELKEMIITGEFDLLLCPYCQKVFTYEDTFIYLDPGAELFVFVMPENPENKEELLKKMKEDYESVKASLVKDKNMGFEPKYLFGAGRLSALLSLGRDIEEETDVIKFTAESAELAVRKISPAFAREHDVPFFIPVPGEKASKTEILEACSGIYSGNDKLKRLKNFIDRFSAEGSGEIPFV